MVSKKKEVKKNVDDVNRKTLTAQTDDDVEYHSMIAEAAYYRAEKKRLHIRSRNGRLASSGKGNCE